MDTEEVFKSLLFLDKKKKCPYCKKKYPDGIINKFPGQKRPLIDFLKGEFLFHLKSTHGYDEETFISFLYNK